MTTKSSFVFFIIFSLILFSTCHSNVQTMLDDYNSHFTNAPLDPPGPDDPGFDENKMLDHKYYVCIDGTINLSAPKSSSYYWKMTDKNKEIIKTYREKDFRFYLPETFSNLDIGTYTLYLEVQDSKGNVYSDTANLIIYEQ